MEEFLPAKLGAAEPSILDALTEKHKKQSEKKIECIEQWVCSFNTYITIMAMKHPEKVGDLLAYSSLIVQNSRAYEGKPWLGYDSHFRRQRAAKRGGMLADVDSSIWTLYFGKAIFKEVCEDCLEPGHKSCFKDTGGEPSQKGKGSETRPAGARFQPYMRPARRTGGRQEVCWLFNSGKECRFEKMPGRSCSFLHACAMCMQEPGSSSEQIMP